MSRKLISLVSTHGKTTEQIVKEVWDSFVNYQATELGLTKCDKCGEYKGLAIEKDGEVGVMCICNGIDCTKCGINRVHRPISNYFSNKDAKIWHVPYFLTMCDDCVKLHNASDNSNYRNNLIQGIIE